MSPALEPIVCCCPLGAPTLSDEEAIATADAEVERLRKKLDAADEAAIQNAKTKAQSEGTSSSEPALRPTPTPTPPPQ